MKHRAIILGVITALAVVAYILSPERHFFRSLFPLTDGQIVSGYDDRSDGGLSDARMGMVDSVLDFECELKGDSSKDAWCGLIWNLDPEQKGNYANWTLVDSVIVELSGKNIDEIVIKIWTYDPDVTDSQKKLTFRQLIKEVPVTKEMQRIAIPMEQFYVPDYWFEQTGADKKLTQRHQEAVARVEIIPGWKMPRNALFSLKIRKIEVLGVSNFALGILLGVFLFIAILAIGGKKKK